MPRTIRTFVEVFGFDSAGGRPRWGALGARLQELPSGDDTAVMLWWLIGRQEFGGQIELFHHTVPAQRPRPAGWLPSDLGWARFGIVVSDFDASLERLASAGMTTMTEPLKADGFRRVCFREPGADAIVEIMEEDPSLPAALSGSLDRRPGLAHVTVSVSDLSASRRQFAELFGFSEISPDAIHRPEHERLWGLDDARGEYAVLDTGDMLLELVRYEHPVPRPPAPDALLSDQGIMNVAVSYRDRSEMVAAVAVAKSLGITTTTEVPASSGTVYLRMADRLSVELQLVPPGLEADFGYVPQELAPPGNPYATRRGSRHE